MKIAPKRQGKDKNDNNNNKYNNNSDKNTRQKWSMGDWFLHAMAATYSLLFGS